MRLKNFGQTISMEKFDGIPNGLLGILEIGSGGWIFGRFIAPFEPPLEELPARSQGFSPGYEPSAP